MPLPTLARAALPRMLLPVAPDDLLALPAMIVAAGSGSSVLSSTADELAGSLFGASLFPWLAMLYWLSHPTVRAPPGVAFGLTFLLAFVFGSIPAAIGAGALYGVSLADADWLHGSAESLLAVTNCIVVLGFRDALGGFDGGATEGVAGGGDGKTARLRAAALACGSLAAFSAVAVYAAGGAAVHTAWLGGVGNLPVALWPAEPANALSVPTWLIHTSSLVEWLVAMGERQHLTITPPGPLTWTRTLIPNPSPHRAGVALRRRHVAAALEGRHVGDAPAPHLWHRRVHLPPLLQRGGALVVRGTPGGDDLPRKHHAGAGVLPPGARWRLDVGRRQARRGRGSRRILPDRATQPRRRRRGRRGRPHCRR